MTPVDSNPYWKVNHYAKSEESRLGLRNERNPIPRTLMPAHPDLIPIVEAIRAKYSLPEISPDDDPITEIFLGDENIPLEDFRKEIEMEVQKTVTLLPPKIADFYVQAKNLLNKPVKIRKYDFLSNALKKALLDYYELAK